jgi:hypothetical protein
LPKKKPAKESATDRHRRDREFVAAILSSSEDSRKSIEALPCEILKAAGVEANGEDFFRYERGGRPGVVSLDFYPMGFARWANGVARTECCRLLKNP